MRSRPRSVQIVGRHPSAWDAPAWVGDERWLMRSAAFHGWADQPWDRLFDMHQNDLIERSHHEILAWYRSLDGTRPIYTCEPLDVPGNRVYPLSKVIAECSDVDRLEDSFTCSVDYMLALAIVEQVEHIDLCGVLMRAHEADEYASQRASVQYWIGRARGAGIRVTVPSASGLCRSSVLYGYNQTTDAPHFPGALVPVMGQP